MIAKQFRDNIYIEKHVHTVLDRQAQEIMIEMDAAIIHALGNMNITGTGNTRKHDWEEIKRLEETPKVSREIPFERFNTTWLEYSTILTMNRNRVVMGVNSNHRNWLAENCTDIYLINAIGDNSTGKQMELMFLSPEDMALFVLKFAR